MTSNDTCQDELDTLLHTSSRYLHEIEAGRFENLEDDIIQHNRALIKFMQGRDILGLARQQQRKLYQLLGNQQAAIRILGEQKQELVGKLAEIRNGRNLKNTYTP